MNRRDFTQIVGIGGLGVLLPVGVAAAEEVEEPTWDLTVRELPAGYYAYVTYDHDNWTGRRLLRTANNQGIHMAANGTKAEVSVSLTGLLYPPDVVCELRIRRIDGTGCCNIVPPDECVYRAHRLYMFPQNMMYNNQMIVTSYINSDMPELPRWGSYSYYDFDNETEKHRLLACTELNGYRVYES